MKIEVCSLTLNNHQNAKETARTDTKKRELTKVLRAFEALKKISKFPP